MNDERGIANAFVEQFMSVQGSSWNKIPNNGDQRNFKFSTFSEEDVSDAIKTLKPKKSTGADNIPAYIAKGRSDFVLVYIFNLSLKNNCVPDNQKAGTIPRIFKKGD